MALGQQDEDGMVTGINVTPLVDVSLVLLIIFMVTARLIDQRSLPLDLPKAAQGQDIQLIFGLELHANGDTVADGLKLVNDDAILAKAREAQAKNPDLRAIIRADTTVQHGRVIRVLDLLKTAGVNKIAFGVTPITQESGAATASPNGSPPSGAPPAPVPAK